MKNFVLGLAVTGFVLAGAQAKVEEKVPANQAAVNLIGDYVIESAETSGQKEPDEAVVGTLLHITEDRILVEDKDHKSTPYIATYELDKNKKPWAITMTSVLEPTKGETAKGLIEKNGDQLRLVYALPGGAAPTGFKTKDNQRLLVLKAATK
jgi:uncharacterized protein (TIGR03067 family)